MASQDREFAKTFTFMYHLLMYDWYWLLTKVRGFQLFSTSQNSISIFFSIFGFHAVVLVKTFLLMNQISITTVGLILTKLRWFQHFGISQNSISNFFEKQIKIMGFHVVVLMNTFPFMYQLLM